MGYFEVSLAYSNDEGWGWPRKTLLALKNFLTYSLSYCYCQSCLTAIKIEISKKKKKGKKGISGQVS